jgi:large conductance mechanosensitive channel
LFYSLDPEKTAGITALAQARQNGAAIIAYGAFLNVVIDFVIVAFCVFLMVKAINKLKGPPPKVEATTRDCPQCLMSIPLKATRCGHCTSTVQA